MVLPQKIHTIHSKSGTTIFTMRMGYEWNAVVNSSAASNRICTQWPWRWLRMNPKGNDPMKKAWFWMASHHNFSKQSAKKLFCYSRIYYPSQPQMVMLQANFSFFAPIDFKAITKTTSQNHLSRFSDFILNPPNNFKSQKFLAKSNTLS